MTKRQVIEYLSNNDTPLLGTVRPAHNRQLDMWDIAGKNYMVTTNTHWSPIKKPGLMSHTYSEQHIVRIQLMTEIY